MQTAVANAPDGLKPTSKLKVRYPKDFFLDAIMRERRRKKLNIRLVLTRGRAKLCILEILPKLSGLI
jgi:hypothetical protein